ncbi:hypothetical protein LQF12_11920 [Ruania suaedae]|uniref:asparagine synthase-related protein n=1 Tax=Ruania suaedae TaxID=2897774 RepID=UPI001E4FCA5C|nr:asparagine synthase-related protein [Ruania suaedae]UFU02212.1 hypothetical protein LQF12_11920 [Ruania suaedae]
MPAAESGRSAEAAPVIVGSIGDRGERARALASWCGGLPVLLDTGDAVASGRGARQAARGIAWSHWPASGAGGHDEVTVRTTDDGVELRGSTSGALPLYVELGETTLAFASSLDALIRTRTTPASPDWDAVAQMVAASGPIGGRTLVREIRRLQPGEVVHRSAAGTISVRQEWSWPEVSIGSATSEDVLAALRETLADLARSGPLISLLSGGWDSRLLLAGALDAGAPHGVRAYTTSSDTGTAMEELVAARVAATRGLPHTIVMPRRDRFASDLDYFAESVDHQTAFHVWLVPLARALHETGQSLPPSAPAAVLDGLGGGLFVGGAFADDSSDTPLAERRLAGVTRYLAAAEDVLAPGLTARLRERMIAGAEPVVQRYLDHPFGHTFTAYVSRTLPGISLAPHGLMARTGPVATPFLSEAVVATALALPPREHAEGRLYPQFTSRLDPRLGAMPTAQELVPWPRPHPRRITSREAIVGLRDLVLTDAVRPLVSRRLAEGGPAVWEQVLSTTGGQHLIRGLAVLSRWCREYEGTLTATDPRELTR